MVMFTLTKGFAWLVSVLSIFVLVYVYSVPLKSMQTNRDGAPHFSPEVIHPETNESIPLDRLIRHFRGE